MSTRSHYEIKRGVSAILGPVFLRPRRAKEISDELYDHAIEAEKKGEADPVGALGPVRLIRNSLQRTFLIETWLFLVAFILSYSIWQAATMGYFDIIFGLVYIFPAKTFGTNTLNFQTFMLFLVFITPSILIALIIRRLLYSPNAGKWVWRITVFLPVVIVTSMLINAVFSSCSVIVQNIFNHNLRQAGSEWTLNFAWSMFKSHMMPWTTHRFDAYIQPFLTLLVPVGILCYFTLRLRTWQKAVLLICIAIFLERGNPSFLWGAPGIFRHLWKHLAHAIETFGIGFWIGFYLTTFDWLWDHALSFFKQARARIFAS